MLRSINLSEILINPRRQKRMTKKLSFIFMLILSFLLTACRNSNNTNAIADKKANTEENKYYDVGPSKTVKLGNQIWMTENLNVGQYRNGDPIPEVTDRVIWNNLKTGAWCYYENNPKFEKMYGKLYNWYAVNDSRGLSLSGWHVASDKEWSNLITFLGGNGVAGAKLKRGPYGDTTASSFNGLPGGFRTGNEDHYDFYPDRYYYLWWSSTEADINSAYSRQITDPNRHVFRVKNSKALGLSVRCLKDK